MHHALNQHHAGIKVPELLLPVMVCKFEIFIREL